MKNYLRKTLRILYPKLQDFSLLNKKLISYFIWQKILGVNRNVPWPVHFTSTVIAPEKITNGCQETPAYAMNSYIDARNGIIIGKNVYFAPKISIISMNHDINDFTKYIVAPPIEIGDNSWIASNSIILPSVKLGKNTIVAAGAVVTKSFEEGNQILAGNPAKKIKSLKEKDK